MLTIGKTLCVCVLGEHMWDLSVLSTWFFCKSKITLKNKAYVPKKLHIDIVRA